MDFTLLGDGTFPCSSEPDFGAAMQADARDLVVMGGHGKPDAKAAAVLTALAAAETQSAHALGQAANRQQWLHERYAQLGMDFTQVQNAMRAHTDFAVMLQGAALDERYRRIAVALEMRDAEELMAALTDGMEMAAYLERGRTYDKGNAGNLSDLFGSATRNKAACPSAPPHHPFVSALVAGF